MTNFLFHQPYMPKSKRKLMVPANLKGLGHDIFSFMCFFIFYLAPGPNYPLGANSNCSKTGEDIRNSMCITVSRTSAANSPSVSLTPVGKFLPMSMTPV
jgi:hypothetical protein